MNVEKILRLLADEYRRQSTHPDQGYVAVENVARLITATMWLGDPNASRDIWMNLFWEMTSDETLKR